MNRTSLRDLKSCNLSKLKKGISEGMPFFNYLPGASGAFPDETLSRRTSR